MRPQYVVLSEVQWAFGPHETVLCRALGRAQFISCMGFAAHTIVKVTGRRDNKVPHWARCPSNGTCRAADRARQGGSGRGGGGLLNINQIPMTR